MTDRVINTTRDAVTLVGRIREAVDELEKAFALHTPCDADYPAELALAARIIAYAREVPR
jgi:hypothetical protein